MINTKYLLYISTCLLISGNVQASNFKLTYDSSDIFSHGSALHTQLHTPNELKPIPLFNPNNAVKLAAVCFAGQENCGELNFNSMDLDTNAQCEDEEYVKVCPEGKVPDGNNRCPHNKSYFKCRDAIDECDDGYSSTECSSEQIIEHYYSNEAGKSCYLCRDKTCSEGGYADYITSCQKGTEISFANKTCYQDVTDKNCEDLGYLSSEPENNKCTPVTECGLSCYQNCYQPTCEEENLFSECPDNHTCTEVTFYGKTCYKDDGQPSCSDGGYKDDIPTNNVCTQVDYYGTRCFKDCYQPTCDNGGYLDAQPAGQTCTPIVYYGRNCFQNDCKASELPLPVLYSDKTVSNSIISGKTPIGIVLDKTKNLAIALQMTDGSGAASWGPTNNDIPSLQNYTQDPSSDSVSGKTLTDNALQQTSLLKNTGSIFYKAYNYQTEGTNKGDWFIPSASELKKLVSNSTAITNTIKQITGKTYSNPQNVIFWASNEYDNGNAWIFSSTSARTSPKYMDEQFWLFYTYRNTTAPLNILYSDMSVSDKIIEGKTPIGVVFDDTNGLAIALEDAPDTLEWGDSEIDVTFLENCDSDPESCDTDGRANTAAIISFGKLTNASYPAAEYCDQYTTEGTNAREWHLPSYAELNKISQKKSQINTTLEMLGKQPLTEHWYWSSTEYGSSDSWTKDMTDGSTYGGKNDYNYVRPVIAYEQAQCIDWEGNLSIVYTDGSVCENIVPSKTPYALILDDDNAYGLVIYDSPKYGTCNYSSMGLHYCFNPDEGGVCESYEYANVIESISPKCTNDVCDCSANTLTKLTNGETNTRNAKGSYTDTVFGRSTQWTSRHHQELFGHSHKGTSDLDNIKGLLYTPSYSEAYTLFLERDRINDRLTELNKYYANLYTLIEKEPIWISTQGWDGSHCYYDPSNNRVKGASPSATYQSYLFIHYRDFVTLAQEYQQ